MYSIWAYSSDRVLSRDITIDELFDERRMSDLFGGVYHLNSRHTETDDVFHLQSLIWEMGSDGPHLGTGIQQQLPSLSRIVLIITFNMIIYDLPSAQSKLHGRGLHSHLFQLHLVFTYVVTKDCWRFDDFFSCVCSPLLQKNRILEVWINTGRQLCVFFPTHWQYQFIK